VTESPEQPELVINEPLEFEEELWIVFTKTEHGTWLPDFPAISEEEAVQHQRALLGADCATHTDDILIIPYVHESLTTPEVAAQLPWNELERRITSLVDRHREDGAFAQKHGHDQEALKLYYAQAQCERILAWVLELKPRIKAEPAAPPESEPPDRPSEEVSPETR